jgi:hypothetical protein
MTDLPDTSPNLGLPFYQTKLNEFEVQHNEALLMLDALVMLAVKDRDLAAPPPSPALGDRYLVKPTGTGDFADNDNRIAQYDIGGWNFYAPQPGWTCYVQDEQALLAWDGESWEPALDVLGGVTELQDLTLLGIGTAADATNPLSAKLNNALWTAKTVAEGGDGDLRYKLGKEDASNTLSLLFQDDFSGRAEIGLTGDDDFHFKVSPDGAAWFDALILDKATGAAKLNSAFLLAGDLAPPQITADQDNYNPTGLSGASVLRLSSDASRGLTGLAGGSDGRVVAIVNAGSNDVALRDANAASSAANRFAFGVDVTLTSKQSVVLWYDATDSRWRLLAGPQAGGGSVPADLDIVLAELALGLADALNVAQFLGSAGNRFADSFDATTYVDTAGATNLDTGTAGQLKPSVAPSAQISTAGKTKIGSMTDGGGLAAGFDGTTSQTQAGSAQKSISVSGFNNTLGVDWGSGVTNTVCRFKVFGPSDNNILGAAGGTNIKLQGSTDNFSSSIVDLKASTAFPTGSGQSLDVTSGITTTTAYRYHRLIGEGNGSNGYAIAELQLFGPDTINNLVVASQALTAAAAPTSIKIVALVEEADTITLGTDLIFAVSRDGGTSWTNATMNDRFTANAIHVLESAAIDVTAQPSGASVKWRITTANNKMVKVHGINLYWS